RADVLRAQSVSTCWRRADGNRRDAMDAEKGSPERTARQRLECAQLADALGPGETFDSGTKLRSKRFARWAGSWRSRRYGLEQMPQLFLDFVGARNRVRDGLPEQFAVALPQPVHGHPDGPVGGLELSREVRIGHVAAGAGQGKAQRVEQSAPALVPVFALQPRIDLVQQRERPALLEDLLGRQMLDRLLQEARFGGRPVHAKDLAAAALL